MRAIVVSNGCIGDYSYYKKQLKEDDYIICADGAIRHCLSLNILPDLWIGDFDSCNYNIICKKNPKLINVQTVKLKCDKDETDTHKACMIAVEKGFTEIVMWGVMGKRADHMMSNVFLLEYLLNQNISATIEDELNVITISDSVYVSANTHKYISLIPIDKEVNIASTEGLLYPLKNFNLKRCLSMGVSNEFISEKACIHIDNGALLIIKSND